MWRRMVNLKKRENKQKESAEKKERSHSLTHGERNQQLTSQNLFTDFQFF